MWQDLQWVWQVHINACWFAGVMMSYMNLDKESLHNLQPSSSELETRHSCLFFWNTLCIFSFFVAQGADTQRTRDSGWIHCKAWFLKCSYGAKCTCQWLLMWPIMHGGGNGSRWLKKKGSFREQMQIALPNRIRKPNPVFPSNGLLWWKVQLVFFHHQGFLHLIQTLHKLFVSSLFHLPALSSSMLNQPTNQHPQVSGSWFNRKL